MDDGVFHRARSIDSEPPIDSVVGEAAAAAEEEATEMGGAVVLHQSDHYLPYESSTTL